MVVATNTDEVVAGIEIPPGGSLLNTWIDQKVIAGVEQSVLVASLYGCSGFVIPILDPDAAPTYDAVWDTQVQKDQQAQAAAFSIDTGSAVTAPEFEIGTVQIAGALLEFGDLPTEIFRRRKLITYVDTGDRMGAADVFGDVSRACVDVADRSDGGRRYDSVRGNSGFGR